MTKRFFFFFPVGVLLIISAVYFILKNHQPAVDSLFKAIPNDAAFIIDIKDFNKFRSEVNTKSKIWDEISQISILSGIQQHLKLTDSLIQRYHVVRESLINKNNILISGHSTGKTSMDLLFCIQISSRNDFKEIAEIFRNTKGSVISEHKYQGNTIYDMLLSSNKDIISFCYLKGVLLISRSSILLENALHKIENKTPIEDLHGLEEVKLSAGKNTSINIYFNFKAIPLLGSKLLDPRYENILKVTANMGDWVELDLNIKPDIIVLNGFSSFQNTNDGLKSIFSGQKPQKPEMFGKIPVNAHTFVILALSNYEQYHKNYSDFKALYKSSAINPIDSFQKTYGINLANDFPKIFENEVGVVYVNDKTDSLSQIFSLIRVKDYDLAEQTVRTWADNISTADGTKNNNKNNEIVPDIDLGFKIYHLAGTNIPKILFGGLFDTKSNDYCMLSDNYLIFGPSVKALTEYSQQIIDNNTLNTNNEFNEFSEYFSSQTNFIFYTKPASSDALIKDWLKPDIAGELMQKPQQLKNIRALVYQFNVSNKGNIYNNVFIKYAQAKIEKPSKTTWETKLEGDCIIKPALVKNHLTRENEIIIQDEKFNVYLINKLGRILWKKNIEEPILSDIYQVDFFKNRKIQYLFNTASKMYIIDRNGENVKNSPIAFKNKATNGLALFDYDRNKDYRIFVACEDKQVYLFDKYGKIEKGWTPKKTEEIVSNPVQHFRFNAADYIVFNDSKNVYITNRRGRVRVKPDAKFEISPNNEVHLITNKKNRQTYFAITDVTGTVYLISTKGKTSTIDLGNFPKTHYFDVLDSDTDGSSEILITTGNVLSAYNQKAELLFQINTESAISSKPNFYELAKKNIVIGLVNSANNNIYLYNTRGELLKGFPLKGNTQFSINMLNNSENRFNLIVGSNKNFLYYYSVQ